MKKVIITSTQTIKFDFDGLDSVTLNMADVTPANTTYAMLHGFAARIGDNAAITKSAENNFTVTEAMRRDAVLEMVNHYTSGSIEWNLKPAAHKPAFNPAIQAIADKLGKTYEEAMAWYNAKLMAELEAM